MDINYKYVLGIDIAKNTFSTRLVSYEIEPKSISKKSKSFPNKLKGFNDVIEGIDKLGADISYTLFVMEATNVYWEALAFFLCEQSLKVSIVNPSRVKGYAISNLARGKDDSLDAYIIACFACNNKITLWNPPVQHLSELRDIMRRCDDIEKNITQETNRKDALLNKVGDHQLTINSINNHIAYLDNELNQLKDTIKVKISQDKDCNENFNIMNKITGIGFSTATILLTETWNFSCINSKNQLTAYAGINPAPHKSGKSVNGKTRISKTGNPRIRKAVYMAALSAIKYNLKMKTFYNNLLSNNKKKKQALVAVARKLLVLAYTLVKNKREYDPNYVSVKPDYLLSKT